MLLTLAPMEGVVDACLRQILTQIGGINLCVSEFIRVTDTLLAKDAFFRYCPELGNDGRTAAGVPVHIQLLGGLPSVLADNAARASELGALGIDLNFGCPSKTVNRRDGGATLLQYPERLHDIVSEVRQTVDPKIPVTAKMRLGFKDKSLAIENALAIESAGAQRLTIHARTKVEGYHPPAHWEYIGLIREKTSLPISANGEIWNTDDYRRCVEVSGCRDIMIGRGVITNPFLPLQIQQFEAGVHYQPSEWNEVRLLLKQLYDLMAGTKRKYVTGRIKQWLSLMGRTFPEAASLFQEHKKLQDPAALIGAILQ